MLTIPRKLALTTFVVIALHATPASVQRGRYIASVASVVDDHQVAIAERFPDDTDFVRIAGQRYPNMPPGMTFLLAPHYWVFSTLIGSHVSNPAWRAGLFSMWVVVTLLAPLLALVSVVMYRLCLRLTPDRGTAVWLTLGLIFGTPIFSYGTQLWSHDFSLAMVLGILYLTVDDSPRRWTTAATGTLVGMLALMENHAPLAIGMLGGFWLWTRLRQEPRWSVILRDAVVIVAMTIPFALALLWYNRAVTGSPFHNAASVWFDQNIPGQPIFVWPTFARVWGMTFSPHRGLFLYAPLTLLAVIGLVRGKLSSQPLGRFAWIFTAGYLALCLTFVQWDDGVSFGPRYFTSAFPFALLAAAVWPAATVRAWAVVAIAINWAGATTAPSDNLFVNLATFAYRGPFLSSLDLLRTEVFPTCCGIHLYAVSPFWLEIGMGALLWWIWRRTSLAGIDGRT